MKEIKRQIVTEETVYEVTEKELEDIKKKARNEGRLDVIGYFQTAIRNYRYEMNLSGVVNCCLDLIDFLSNKTDTIPNTHGWSFRDYVDINRK